jgi:hypothetical protein
MHGQVSDVVLRTADKDLRTSDETVLPNLTNDIILLQFAHLYESEVRSTEGCADGENAGKVVAHSYKNQVISAQLVNALLIFAHLK